MNNATLRRLVPPAVRHGISARVARVQAARLERDLAALASGTDTIVAGPWLGEVGFELLYWVPFLRWFAGRFRVDPARLLVVSRGGAAPWYRPFAGRYREIFDYLTPDEFRRRHDERLAANGEQKQTKVLAFERELLRDLTADVRNRSMLHPSTMYGLFSPYWWGHLQEPWVLKYARYERLQMSCPVPYDLPARPYTAVKFYFNDCFPETDENRERVKSALQRLAGRGPVVSLATRLQIDDHEGFESNALGVRSLPSNLSPRDNLAVQTAVVAGASEFIGTYGGFSYLAPFLGVRTTAYYSDPHGFSARHLHMARAALRTIEAESLFDVNPMQT